MSGDSDLLNYKSEILYPIADYDELIDAVIRENSDKLAIIKFLESEPLESKDSLMERIESYIYDFIEEEFDLPGHVDNLEIENLVEMKINNAELGNYSITYIDQSSAKIECYFTFLYELVLDAIDF